jgi:hypothetical protein
MVLLAKAEKDSFSHHGLPSSKVDHALTLVSGVNVSPNRHTF